MSINYAILGLLSYKPLTGYDIKKIIQDSPVMYWSGNNNQIYKALVELLDEGMVSSRLQPQERSPSKKIYTLTDEGREALKKWVLTVPEAPEVKKTFLIQLAWAENLNNCEMDELLSAYESEIKMQRIMLEEKKRRETFAPGRTQREVYLWDMIHQNIVSACDHELDWVQKLRSGLNLKQKEGKSMNYNVVEKENKKYIEFISGEKQILTEQDTLDLVAVCYDENLSLILLHEELIPDDFFKLRTGLAGQVLQKFINYHIKAAVLITDEQKIKGKFKELLAESKKGKDFCVFSDIVEAENWLLK